MQKHNYNIIIILFVAGVSYLNLLNARTFIFDDAEAVLKNEDLSLHRAMYNIFYDDFWGTKLLSNYSHKSYRPLTSLFYRFNIYLTGSKIPTWFHALSVILYMVVCVAHYIFLTTILIKTKSKYNIAFSSSLLFCVHPIHTEVVSSVVGQADLLCSIVFFVAIVCYKQAIIKRSLCLYFLTVLLAGMSMLFKETGITVLGLCCFYDALLILTKPKIYFHRHFFARQIGLVTSAVYILYWRWKIMNFTKPIFQPSDNPASFAKEFWTRVFSYNYIYFLNTLLLFWPQWLCFDWSMGCIPLIERINDPRIVLVCAFWCALIVLSTVLIKKRSQVLLMATGFCVIPFLPASNVWLRVGFVIAERTLFLPSVGFCLIVSCGFHRIYETCKRLKKILNLCFILLCVILMSRTWQRSKEWLNEEDLFTSAIEVCPNNAKVHYNIAKVAADNSDIDLAETEYRKAIELHPIYDQAMNNLANILRDLEQLDEAKYLLLKAVELRPEFAAAWMNLGVVYATLNEDGNAEMSYLMALKHRRSYADCYYNLGNLYLKQNRNEEALHAWERAFVSNPSHSAAWSNTLVLLDGMGRQTRVIEVGKIALTACPKSPALHFTVANTLGKLERWQDAESHFQMAIELSPNNALYHSNFGVLYHRWGKRAKAINQYEIALRINPNLISASRNLERIQ